MSTRHTLINLPLVVQDLILDKLDRVSLTSVSLTCRSLHRGARRFLYRELTRYEKHRDLVESILQRDPTLIPYIHSFTSFDRSLLQWMWLQRTPSLRNLEIRWNFVGIAADVKFIESIPPETGLESLTFELISTLESSLLSCINAFGHLKHLKLQIEAEFVYTLQTILEQLYCPTLVFLEVEMIADWRIQWRESFEESLPNLQGLRLKVDLEDPVMYDQEDEYLSEERLPPGNVMWETVLTLQRRSIFFDIEYYELDHPFLDYAPSYAASHQLDLASLVQWHIKSLMFFRTMQGDGCLFVNIKAPQFTDLIAILDVITRIDFHRFKMVWSLKLPRSSSPLISSLLPDNIFKLFIYPPSNSPLHSAVIPACIRSLPNLEYLYVYIDVSTYTFKPFNSCTTARYSFRSPPTGKKLIRSYLEITHPRYPIWNVKIWDISNYKIEIEHDPGADMIEFEEEVIWWFKQSTSLKILRVFFEPEVDS